VLPLLKAHLQQLTVPFNFTSSIQCEENFTDIVICCFTNLGAPPAEGAPPAADGKF